MQASGSGLTFTDDDLVNARRIVGLLSRAEFKVQGAALKEGGLALIWFEQLIEQIKAHMFEILSIKSQVKEVAVVEEK